MTAEELIRRQIFEACRYLSGRGFLAGTGGNVSMRVDGKRFAITPSGMDYHAMTARDVCIVNLDTLALEEGASKPSVECGLHAALLRGRPDAAAAVHTHQPLASAVALLGVEPGVPDELREVLGPRVPVVGYAPSGTPLLVHALRKELRPDAHAYLLRNHGMICCGTTMAAAISIAEHLESAARCYLREAIRIAGASEVSRAALEALQ